MNEAYKDVRRLKMTLKTLEITRVEACCHLYTDANLKSYKIHKQKRRTCGSRRIQGNCNKLGKN